MSASSSSEGEAPRPSSSKKGKEPADVVHGVQIKMSKEKKTQYREIFDSVDTDGKGDIAARELKRVMRMIGASAAAADVQEMIALADKDVNGTVDFDEFCFILEIANMFRYNQLLQAFKVFDEDNSGRITAMEFKKVLDTLGVKITEKERKDMIKKADRDHNGELDLDEFLTILRYSGAKYTEKELTVLEGLNLDAGVSVAEGASSDDGAADEEAIDPHALFDLEVVNFYLDETFTFKDCKGTMKVSAVAKKLAKKTGYPVDVHRLYYAGFPLNPDYDLQTYKMTGSKPVSFIYGQAPTPLDSDKCWDDDGLPNLKNIYEHFRAEGLLRRDDAFKIVEKAKTIMAAEPNLLEIDEGLPVIIVGDIHGQFFDLQEVFEAAGHELNDTASWVFLGDYVDRGSFSAECILYLYAAKIAFPNNVHLLRGNHEAAAQNKSCGSVIEFDVKYGVDFHPALVQSYYRLPLAATVTHHGHTFLCCHGGIARELPKVSDYNTLNRVQEVPARGAMKITLWSDPFKDNEQPKKTPWPQRFDLTKLKPTPMDESDFAKEGARASASAEDDGEDYGPGSFHKSSRGSAVRMYGRRAVLSFLRENNVTCVFRGHEQKQFGYEAYKRGPDYNFPSVMTVFSAPNYTDSSLNDGAIVRMQDGVVEVFTYKWRVHPQYFPCTKNKNQPHPKACQKNVKMDDFLHFVSWLHPEALNTMTVKQLHKEYNEMFQTDLTKHGDDALDEDWSDREDDWAKVSGNLNRVLEMSKDPKVREMYKRKSQAMLLWYQGYNHFEHALQEESQYETDDGPSSSCCTIS